MKWKGIVAVSLLIVMSVADVSVNSQTYKEEARTRQYRSPFRYVVVSNKVDPAINKQDVKRRFVTILLDKKSFSKENLIILFQLVAKRYPTPNLLNIDVYTDLEDIETPEEADMGKMSETSDPVRKEQDSATGIRHHRKIRFYIYFTDGSFDEVELKYSRFAHF